MSGELQPCREEFEAMMRREYFLPLKRDGELYAHDTVQMMWFVWQAAWNRRSAKLDAALQGAPTNNAAPEACATQAVRERPDTVEPSRLKSGSPERADAAPSSLQGAPDKQRPDEGRDGS